jgi:hypothetical protein
MVTAATGVMGFPVEAVALVVGEFEKMALGVPGDGGYRVYLLSVVGMFEGLGAGKYAWHEEVYPDVFEGVGGRERLKD